jgi:hypothetical protein
MEISATCRMAVDVRNQVQGGGVGSYAAAAEDEDASCVLATVLAMVPKK